MTRLPATSSATGQRGPIHALDPNDMSTDMLHNPVYISPTPGGQGTQTDTQGTVAVYGNRICIASQDWYFTNNVWTRTGDARLVALDVDINAGAGSVLDEVWRCKYKTSVSNGSRSSPLIIEREPGKPTIYFDGEMPDSSTGVLKPRSFAIEDNLKIDRLRRLWAGC